LNIGLTEPLVCLSKKISPINLLPTEIAGAATQKDNGTGGKPKQVANSIQYLPKSQE
jgi:BarA-like signal transduction histidine kinase